MFKLETNLFCFSLLFTDWRLGEKGCFKQIEALSRGRLLGSARRLSGACYYSHLQKPKLYDATVLYSSILGPPTLPSAAPSPVGPVSSAVCPAEQETLVPKVQQRLLSLPASPAFRLPPEQWLLCWGAAQHWWGRPGGQSVP